MARLIGYLLLAGLAILMFKWALITAAILVVPFGVWWLYDRATTTGRRQAAVRQRRAQLERLAAVDAWGGCGWCGSQLVHVDGHGVPVPPLSWHRADIEAALRHDELGLPNRT